MNIRNCNYGLEKTYSKWQKIVYRIGNVLSVTPWYDFQKNTLKHIILNKLYAVVCGVTLGAFLFIFTFIKSMHFRENIYDILLLSISGTVSLYLMEYLIFGSTFVKHHKWNVFMQKFTQTAAMQTPKNNNTYRQCSKFFLHLILGHIYFVGVHIYNGYEWLSSIGVQCVIYLMVRIIPEYYCFLYTMLSSSFTQSIRRIYEDLNNLLEKDTEEYYSKLHHDYSEEKYLMNIASIGKRYREVMDLVRYYNDLFGSATLLIFLRSILQILRCSNLVLIMMDNPKFSWTTSISIWLSFTINMGESVYIILCCEQASCAGKKMKQLCHKLQEKFDVDSRTRQELFRLADIVTSYKPKFTAANFFDINQRIILKILNIATTYLIVIIQFYSTVRERLPKESLGANKN